MFRHSCGWSDREFPCPGLIRSQCGITRQRRSAGSAASRGWYVYAEDYVASVAYFLVTEALAGLAVYAGPRASSMTQGQVLVPLTLLTGVRILELSRTASAVARYNQRHGSEMAF